MIELKSDIDLKTIYRNIEGVSSGSIDFHSYGLFPGIYEIWLGGKVYNGESKNIYSRISYHKKSLEQNKYGGGKLLGKKEMQELYNKDNKDVSVFYWHMPNSTKREREIVEDKITKIYHKEGISLNTIREDVRKIVGTFEGKKYLFKDGIQISKSLGILNKKSFGWDFELLFKSVHGSADLDLIEVNEAVAKDLLKKMDKYRFRYSKKAIRALKKRNGVELFFANAELASKELGIPHATIKDCASQDKFKYGFLFSYTERTVEIINLKYNLKKEREIVSRYNYKPGCKPILAKFNGRSYHFNNSKETIEFCRKHIVANTRFSRGIGKSKLKELLETGCSHKSGWSFSFLDRCDLDIEQRGN